MLTRTEELFFELLRIALGTQETLTGQLSDEEWLDVSQMAVKQSVLGILYSAVEKLPEGQRPPTDLQIDMYQCVQEIEDRNRHMNKMTALVSSRFRKDGFPNCILKGQGIALLYPNPLRRQSGDIDIWLKGERKEIVRYLKSYIEKTEKPGYVHIGFNLKDGTSIEVHFTPSYMFNILKNSRMQKWFELNKNEQMNHFLQMPYLPYSIPVPTASFNMVYSLNHIFRHFFNGGIGVRHIVDYFYILQQFCSEQHSDEEIEEIRNTIDMFHMSRFATSLYWILKNALGVKDGLLLFEPNEAEGRFLLKEVMVSGNFGKSDPQQQKNKGKKNLYTFFNNQSRIMRFFSRYPEEVCWRPIVSIKNQLVEKISFLILR